MALRIRLRGGDLPARIPHLPTHQLSEASDAIPLLHGRRDRALFRFQLDPGANRKGARQAVWITALVGVPADYHDARDFQLQGD